MRIAMVGSRGLGSNYGGIERCLDELCPRLLKFGHTIDVFAENDLSFGLPTGLRSIRVPTIGGKHFSNLSRSTISTIKAIGNYDVVHFHATGPSSLSFMTVLRGQATVATIHALDQTRAKWGKVARLALAFAEKSALTFADEVTVVSESLRRYVKERHNRNAYYLPNAVPTKPYQENGEFLQNLGLEKHGYFLFASRLTPEKGCHDLIRAFRASHSHLKLVIAGGNGSEQYKRELQDAADLTKTVFVGHLEGKRLAEIFSNAHTFILPSYIEGMSIALLEAIAYKLPIIVSDIPENLLVVGNIDGTYPVGSTEVLAEKIRRFSSMQRSDIPSYVPTDQFLDWEQIAEGYDSIYKKAILKKQR